MSGRDSHVEGLRGVDLRLGYHGATVVHDAAITLRPGAVTALVGPNGSGKSTLLRGLARLHPLEHGEVQLADGTSARTLTAREFARRVTLLAQSRPTPSGVTVRDVVGYGRHPYRGRWRAGDPDGPAMVDRAMATTGVTAMADRPVDELSGGELQRVWLATCLAQDTGVLLLDEPTTFLDLRYQVEILDLMRDLADDDRVAVGVVLHDLNQAAAVADEVVLLHAGRVRATGSPADVLTEEALTETYGIRIEVTVDPLNGLLSTRPVGRHSTRSLA
ncbi:iron-dicitrate transporter ATP-binding subunit [Micromonospora echinospora]|uniref:Iron complex transport system ATP-binding protein n=1 Tax=Micromonospora echinospora TaxID=1877 RepID=A0A1C4VPG9_MICEC|nr:ABC transporter ATP-binding protein [Micromonospora echinospora]OZV76682.1 iron-dicitrate transporter ATP-binding subunit [Micromonospora echinospora]SCE85695.1 iron complex transport system ATP-binding protein [Micromonospora echinospora]